MKTIMLECERKLSNIVVKHNTNLLQLLVRTGLNGMSNIYEIIIQQIIIVAALGMREIATS